MQTNKIVSIEGYTEKEQKSTILMSNPQGGLPECNEKTEYCKYPNEWWDIQFTMDSSEWFIVSYVMKHTYRYVDKTSPTGRQEMCRLSADDFAYGRKKAGGVRMDTGTGLSPKTAQIWINKALEHNHIYYEERLNERGRIDFWYGVTFYKRSLATSNLPSGNNVNLSNILATSNLPSDTTLATSNLPSSGYVKTTYPIQKETTKRNLSSLKETDTHLSFLEIENNTLMERLVTFIRERTTLKKITTFVDIEKFLHTMIPTKGNENVVMPNYDNVVLWSWINQRFIDVVMPVIKNSKIITVLVVPEGMYAKAKKHPHYSIGERGIDYKDDDIHWLPTSFEYCGPTLPEEPKKKKQPRQQPTFHFEEGQF